SGLCLSSVAVSAIADWLLHTLPRCGTLRGRVQDAFPIDLGSAALSLAHQGPEMAKDFIGYQTLTDAALRSVVRDALRRVEKSGLIGSHHFYLTFKTQFPGVAIPDFLREQYPEEMTIILQHQFWGLHVRDDGFEV